MKLSIVIICWNDRAVISDCLRSIYAETRNLDFEVIVADNASTDSSLHHIREQFPAVRIVANRTNLGFGPGNNAGIRAASGEYILLLNPDTVIRDRALEKLVAYAVRHPEAGAFGCRTLNPDGSLQSTAHPAPTVFGYLIWALYVRPLGRISDAFLADEYCGWDGRTEREIGFHAACCLLMRGKLLKELGGFDERFFHQFEDADLCRRVWLSGKSVLFCPEAEIVHIGGQNRGRYPVRVILETQRSKYRYFQKQYGDRAARQVRWVSLLHFGLRSLGYGLRSVFCRDEILRERMKLYHTLLTWHWHLDPVRFVRSGTEPDVGCAPLGATSNSGGSASAKEFTCANSLVG